MNDILLVLYEPSKNQLELKYPKDLEIFKRTKEKEGKRET